MWVHIYELYIVRLHINLLTDVRLHLSFMLTSRTVWESLCGRSPSCRNNVCRLDLELYFLSRCTWLKTDGMCLWSWPSVSNRGKQAMKCCPWPGDSLVTHHWWRWKEHSFSSCTLETPPLFFSSPKLFWTVDQMLAPIASFSSTKMCRVDQAEKDCPPS